MNFSNRFICLHGGTFKTLQAAKDAGEPTINYGLFINNILDFVIVAFCIFLVVKQINRFRQMLPTGPAVPTTKSCPECLSTIPIQAKRCMYCTSNVDG